MAIKSSREKVVRLPIGNQKDARAQFLPADRIEYMIDMLLQLKVMAAAGNLQVLSGIIEVAYQEARAQVGRS